MITAIKKNKFESIRPWQRSHFLEQNLLCLTKSSSLLNRRILQMLQLNGLGLSWMRLVWPSRRWILAKLLSQRLHLNGLSLRCTSFMCCSSPKSMKKRLWHILHWWDLCFSCTRLMCLTTAPLEVKLFWHMSQVKDSGFSLQCWVCFAKAIKFLKHFEQLLHLLYFFNSNFHCSPNYFCHLCRQIIIEFLF